MKDRRGGPPLLTRRTACILAAILLLTFMWGTWQAERDSCERASTNRAGVNTQSEVLARFMRTAADAREKDGQRDVAAAYRRDADMLRFIPLLDCSGLFPDAN